jgi:hypothetical protein
MSLHQAPLQGKLKPDMATPHATSTRVRGRRLLLMRLGWTLLTAFNLVVFFVSAILPLKFYGHGEPIRNMARSCVENANC